MGFKTSQFTPELPPENWALDKNDKWRLASHIQKSVRQGKADHARWGALELSKIDRSYLSYRLSVIAVEDVGAGDPDLIWDIMKDGWGKKVIEEKGGVEFLIETAVRYANAVKDRLPCDWISCHHWLTPFEQKYGPWKDIVFNDAVDGAFNLELSWWERGLFAWSASGTKRFASSILPTQEGDWEGWKDACVSKSGFDAMGPIMKLGEHQREAHPVFLGLSIAERLRRPESRIEDFKLLNLPNLGPWLSSTYDKHTSEGIKAIKYWLRQNHQAQIWLSKKGLNEDEQIDAIGRLMFWMEGSVCNREWTHDLTRQVRTDGKRLYLQHFSLAPKEFASLCAQPFSWQAARSKIIDHQSCSRAQSGFRI